MLAHYALRLASLTGLPFLARFKRRWGEPEMWLLPTLVRRDAVAIDVGAANGVYAYFLQRLARMCHAFEANPNSGALLRRRLPGVTVHACALSDACGEAELRMPVVNGAV